MVERPLSTGQIVKNVASVLGQSDESLEGTKRWRLEWWSIIIRDTVFGPNLWTGRGFGLNIAVADGFGDDLQRDPLRSPHNAHITILARAGVPGLALWLLFLVSWLAMLASATLAARRRRQPQWAGLFLFVGCYVVAALINATFDVALEGPMQGIWFWCLIGFGIGSVMIYRYQAKALPQQWAVP
jgi:O-antigen ligase